MSKYSVIGGSGFVGSRLIQLLGYENCHNIDKNESPFYKDITTIQNICNKGLSGVLSKESETVVLLAAEHRDDVSPTSLYFDVNVTGTKNVLKAMDENGIRNIIFTSSVAIYGLNRDCPDEECPSNPFGPYGKSKWQAEELLRSWYEKDPENRSLTIIRPSVIFGERNRGNVFNLLNYLASGNFLMVGKGENRKSMAYVGNVAAFIDFTISTQNPGYRIFNYLDTPDFSMNELLIQVERSLDRKLIPIRIPYFIGMLGGHLFDLMSKISGKKMSVSSLRVKKFCARTQFDATKAHHSGFKVKYTLIEGLHRTLQFEFLDKSDDEFASKKN